MPRTGRPKSDAPLRVRTFRTTDSLWARVRSAATAEGLTVQAFILAAVCERLGISATAAPPDQSASDG